MPEADNKPHSNPPAWFVFLSILLVCVWAALAALGSYRTQTWAETLGATSLFIVVCATLLMGRGPMRLSSTPGGRLALAGLFVAAALSLYPAFHLNVHTPGTAPDDYTRAGLIGAALVCAALGLLSFTRPAPDTAAPGSASRIEAFLVSPPARRNLLIIVLFALPVGFALSGYSIRTALWPLAFFAALVLALKSLLALARNAWGARALGWMPLLACAVAGGIGLNGYRVIQSDINASARALAADKPGEAHEAYKRVVSESIRLRAEQPRIELDSIWARNYERINNPGAAQKHWQQVAWLLNVSGEQFLPLQRVQCAQGDSLLAWRRLVFEGFDAIDKPELLPGIKRLGEVSTDVRGKLLAALVAWERNEPDSERKKLLLDAQRLSPGEPTSFNLLKRLGETPPAPKDNTLWLPPALLLGPRPSPGSIDGLIDELGEIGTLVYLEEGHWEMSLRAAGTPLNEEWPVVRVELGGQILGPTQVNKAMEHDVPFSFDVRTRDLFTLRIKFLNHRQDLEAGRIARRGLRIAGIKLVYGKE